MLILIQKTLSSFSMPKAPEGHFYTWLINSSVVAFSGFIQGRSFGLYTLGKVFTQIPEWIHFSGFHKMVISPFEYPIVFIAFLISSL